MKSYTSKEIRNVVMLGHSGSGKTTITESCLFKSGATKRFGKVDEGNTVTMIRKKSNATFQSIHQFFR